MFAVRPACNRDRDLADEPHWCSSVFGCRNARGVVEQSTWYENGKPALSEVERVDDIFGYDKLVATEKATLHKGMNYRVGKELGVLDVNFTSKYSVKSGLNSR
jgi:hypothetical protein